MSVKISLKDIIEKVRDVLDDFYSDYEELRLNVLDGNFEKAMWLLDRASDFLRKAKQIMHYFTMLKKMLKEEEEDE